MPVVRTAVLLFAYPAGQTLNLHGNVSWYDSYFFSPVYGQAAYWLKQTNYEKVFVGQVFDWVPVGEPAPDLTDRKVTIDRAIRTMEEDSDVDFSSFEVIILVLGVRDGYPSDGGSIVAASSSRKHHGIVTRVKDRFDFVAHELGHALKLEHSFGNPAFKVPGDAPGGYAHPYCVMSAMAYGGVGGPYFPPTPRDGRPEYSALGPSLNATTALGRGWIRAHTYRLPADGIVEYTLRSRHWFGQAGGFDPQALEVLTSDGRNYVIEYREDAGWDAGQGSPVLIIAQGRGSTGDAAHPNSHSTTYLGMIRLPVTLGSHTSVYNGPKFGLEVLATSSPDHTVRVRIRPGPVQPTEIVCTDAVNTLREDLIGFGVTTWELGEVLWCPMRGTWAYRELVIEQEAVVEATYPSGAPVTVKWTVDGAHLKATSGQLFLNKVVDVANARLDSLADARTIVVSYTIEPLPTGSRLRLANRPEDETYLLDVKAVVSTSAGSADTRSWVQLCGREFRYPQEMYDARDACIANYIRINQRFAKYKVLLEPDLWKRVGLERAARVQQLTDALACLRTEGDDTAVEQVVGELAALVGEAGVQPRFISLESTARVEVPEGPIPPPAPEVRPWFR